MPERTALDLQDELSRRSGKRVMVCLTDNRRNMVTARRLAGGAVEARLQRMFLAAPDAVLDELADMMADRRGGRTALRAFIDTEATKIPAPPARRRPPSAASQASSHHDIVGYAQNLNQTYLGDRSRAGVLWGRRNRTRSRRSIRFGCYDPSRNVIIMNRKLDSPHIPAYFVEYILFHEMLHEVLGIEEGPDGRRNIHGKLFKLMESTFPDFEKAQRFEKELCKRLGSL